MVGNKTDESSCAWADAVAACGLLPFAGSLKAMRI
jgi:hypothetical protein